MDELVKGDEDGTSSCPPPSGKGRGKRLSEVQKGQILALSSAGWKPAQIAKRIDATAGSVSKMLTRHKARALARAQAILRDTDTGSDSESKFTKSSAITTPSGNTTGKDGMDLDKPEAKAPKRLSNVDRDTILALKSVDWSIADIAKHLGATQAAVSKFLQRYKLAHACNLQIDATIPRDAKKSFSLPKTKPI